MRLGFFFLVVAYVLSQFYRSFLAVLTPDLQRDLGATPADLSDAAGLWFLVFAGMQVPIGWLLDRIGPRRTAPVMLAIGGAGGAAMIATATTPAGVSAGMVLIGIGCAPVLMASFFIFARQFSARVFATLSGALVGAGTLGNIASSAPLAWAALTFGWRGTMWGLAALTFVVAVALYLLIRDPEPVEHTGAKGRLLDLLRMPALWLIFPLMFVNYAPSIGIRGLWSGPYLERVFGLDGAAIGGVTLLMGLAMVAGNFLYGPLDRVFGTRKWVVLTGLGIGAVACFALARMVEGPLAAVTALFIVIGLTGGSFAVIMAHGRSFVPAHLTGRGVTLLNLFGMGGAGVMQVITGRIFDAGTAAGLTDAENFARLFAFYGITLVAGCAIYLFSRDRTD